MLTLGSAGIQLRNFEPGAASFIIRVSSRDDRLGALRATEAYLVEDSAVAPNFALYIAVGGNNAAKLSTDVRAIILPESYHYLADGDVIRIVPSRQAVRVLYRRNSAHNTFLLTERCNHYCLMCSQPPKDIDDSWIVDEVLSAIPLIDPATVELGLSGGEPTLLGNDLLRIIGKAKAYLPSTAIHILSNGRRFSDEGYARELASLKHNDLMIGIPIYSDVPSVHDYVVQAAGAFDETIKGILNLKRHRQKVEIRIVVHRQTYRRLPQLAEFIARNLTFVDHVALMGLEMTGFTKANLNPDFPDVSTN